MKLALKLRTSCTSFARKAEAEVKERRQELAQLENRLLAGKKLWTTCRRTWRAESSR